MITKTIDPTEDDLRGAGFAWRERGGVRALVCPALEHEGFANAFSTRTGGVSPLPDGALNLAGFDDDAPAHINENRRRFLRLLDGEWNLLTVFQVHGDKVEVVCDDQPIAADAVRADALATNVPKILLGVKTADCVPVLLGDERTGACAAVHAGWRGTLAGIVRRAVETMNREFGTAPQHLRAAIGPAALACCYEVGTDVIEAFGAVAAADLFTPTRDGHAFIDLHRANRDQLLAAGLDPLRIHTAPLCTISRPDLFFSYRRDWRTQGRVGRLLSVIGRQKNINKIDRESR